MATMGGSRDQKVPAKGVAAVTASSPSPKVGRGAPLYAMPRTTSSTIKTPSAIQYAIFVLFFSIMSFTSS